MLGIKIVKVSSGECLKIVGRDENTERFIKLALYQGKAIKAQKGGFGGTLAKLDPTFITNSYKKNRFYMFSRRMPVD
jgi:peptidylprolyl isomerase domain and WD repeat-containing protein 1